MIFSRQCHSARRLHYSLQRWSVGPRRSLRILSWTSCCSSSSRGMDTVRHWTEALCWHTVCLDGIENVFDSAIVSIPVGGRWPDWGRFSAEGEASDPTQCHLCQTGETHCLNSLCPVNKIFLFSRWSDCEASSEIAASRSIEDRQSDWIQWGLMSVEVRDTRSFLSV